MKKVICNKAVKGIVLGTILILGVIGVIAVKASLPNLYSPWMWLAPAIFLLLSCMMLHIIDRFENYNERQILNRMMLYKVIKFTLCIAAILVFYFMLAGNQRNGFLILFMVYFLIMTALETFAFGNFERANKLRINTYKKEE